MQRYYGKPNGYKSTAMTICLGPLPKHIIPLGELWEILLIASEIRLFCNGAYIKNNGVTAAIAALRWGSIPYVYNDTEWNLSFYLPSGYALFLLPGRVTRHHVVPQICHLQGYSYIRRLGTFVLVVQEGSSGMC